MSFAPSLQWATDTGLDVLGATCAIEMYVRVLERGLAATTIDRRLYTVCGYCRFPSHIDARIASNLAQRVRRSKVYQSDARGLTAPG